MIIILEVIVFFGLTSLWIIRRYRENTQVAGSSPSNSLNTGSLITKECNIVCGTDIGIECPPKECSSRKKSQCSC